jgi:hypothetical protein
MTSRATALRIVSPPAPPSDAGAADARAPASDLGGLLVLAMLLAVSLVPIAGLLAGGRWGDRMVGVATAMVLLAGRELARELRTSVRKR